MQISGIRQGLQAQPVQKKAAPQESQAPEKNQDTVSISDGGRALQAAQQASRQRLDALQRLDNVRQDRVEEVRAKIAEGLFNSREILAQVADRVLRGFGL